MTHQICLEKQQKVSLKLVTRNLLIDDYKCMVMYEVNDLKTTNTLK